MRGFGFVFAFLSGIGIASGSFSSVLGSDWVSPLDSFARTFCVWTDLAGRGTELTRVTPIASPPPPAPQVPPWPPGPTTAYKMMEPAIAMCSAADQARLRPQRSCSKKISALAAMTFERLGHDAHVRDSRLLDRIHHCCEGAEGHVLVRTDEDGLVFRIADFLPQLGGNLVDVDGVVPQEHALLLVDADDQAFFGDLLHGARLGNADLNPRLQHRRGHHEDDQKHQNDVDQRRDVDVGERSLGASVRSREGHYRRTSGAAGCDRSTAFSISSAKSSPRAANSRMELPSRL